MNMNVKKYFKIEQTLHRHHSRKDQKESKVQNYKRRLTSEIKGQLINKE